MSLAGSAEGFFSRALKAVCFQATGNVAVSMEELRMRSRASLMGVSPFLKTCWEFGSDRAPGWMYFMVVVDSSVVIAVHVVRVRSLAKIRRLAARLMGSG